MIASLPFRDVVIHDQTERCPYLPDRTARLPLSVSLSRISGEEIDSRLALGQRRTGEFVYVTKCPACRACEPIRLDVGQLQLGRTHRRILKRNDAQIELIPGEVQADKRRVDLFNKHRRHRGLGRTDSDIDLEEYRWAFQRSCFDSFEIALWLRRQLVAVAICDRGKTCLSAVYTYYDTEFARYSLGTYCILKQVEYCRHHRLQYLYLGFYIATSPHMSYKASFRPHQRLIDGKWQCFQ